MAVIRKRMTDPVDWSWWRSFLAAAEAGSLSAAARTLGVTQPTLSRHMDALESAVGQRLFVRTPQGLVATDAARALLPEARAMALAAEALQRRASGPEDAVAGDVRVSASHVVGIAVLPSILAPLLHAHPALRVELDLSNASADLAHHAADLAVRMVRPTQASLHARRLGSVRLGLFAHVDYLDRAGCPQTVEDLGSHVVIGPDRDAAALAGFAAAGVARDAITLRTDSEGAQLAAIRAGVGIGVMHADLGAADPSLRPVLPDLPLPALDAWLVVHADLRALRRVRVVADHLAAHLGARWG